MASPFDFMEMYIAQGWAVLAQPKFGDIPSMASCFKEKIKFFYIYLISDIIR